MEANFITSHRQKAAQSTTANSKHAMLVRQYAITLRRDQLSKRLPREKKEKKKNSQRLRNNHTISSTLTLDKLG